LEDADLDGNPADRGVTETDPTNPTPTTDDLCEWLARGRRHLHRPAKT